MDFLRLNGKKILVRLLINLLIDSTIALVWYIILKKHHNSPGDTPIMLTLVYGFGLTFFLIFWFAAWHRFNVAKKLFRTILSLDIFDDHDYFIAYLQQHSHIFYTQKCLCGKIAGYPVVISFDLAMGEHETSKLAFEFMTVNFKHTVIERLNVELNWLKGYSMRGDPKKAIYDFVETLKAKSTVAGNFDTVIDEKRISLVNDQSISNSIN